MSPTTPAISSSERERFKTILQSARGKSLQQWSTRTATRALGWAQYLESKAGSTPIAMEDDTMQTMINARRILLRTMLLSPHLPDTLLAWAKSAYTSNGLTDAYERDWAQRAAAVEKLDINDQSLSKAQEVREAEIKLAALLFLHQTLLDKEKRESWVSVEGEKDASEVKIVVNVLVDLVQAREAPKEALHSPGVASSAVEGLEQAHAAFIGLCKDDKRIEEMKSWIVECLVTHCSPVVWRVVSDKSLRTICRKELGFTLQFYTHLFTRYKVAWRSRNSTDMAWCSRKCRNVLAAAPWVKTLFDELVDRSKQQCFEDLRVSCLRSAPEINA